MFLIIFFILNENRTKIKSDYIAYRLTSFVAVNGNSPFSIIIPRKDVFADTRDSYLEVKTQTVKRADDSLYADGWCNSTK